MSHPGGRRPPETPSPIELLKPYDHLTSACWRDFKKFVVEHAGWTAKRRQATQAEKLKHGMTRKGAVYFVDVMFKPGGKPKSDKATAGKKTVQKTPADAAEEAVAKAQLVSSMSARIAVVKRPAEAEEEAVSEAPPASKKPCIKQVRS